MTDSPDEPVRIVIAYPDGTLPSAWFQAVQRTRRLIRRGGYRARVGLVPVSEVPPNVDALIATSAVATMLADVAARASIYTVVTEPEALSKALEVLVEQLIALGRLRRGPEPPRTIAIHRGFQAVGERARLAD